MIKNRTFDQRHVIIVHLSTQDSHTAQTGGGGSTDVGIRREEKAPFNAAATETSSKLLLQSQRLKQVE